MEIQPRRKRVEALLDRDFAWTARQQDVLALLAKGRSNQEIADQLGVTLDGAKWHLREILSKLGVDSREEAAEYWRRRNGFPGRAKLAAVTLLASWKPLVAAGAMLACAGGISAAVLGRSGDGEPASSVAAAETATPTLLPTITPPAPPTAILTPGPRPTPRNNCFPGGCTSSVDGPPQVAPPGAEWVMSWIPRLEAMEIRVGQIARSHLESFTPDQSVVNAAYLVTNLGILELMELPDGVTDEQVSIVTEPVTCSPPSTECGNGWRYAVTFGTLGQVSMAGTALTLEGMPVQFAVGSGLFVMAWSETLAERAALALDGRRLR